MNIVIKNTDRLLYDGSSFSISKGNIYIENGIITSVDKAPDGFSTDKEIDGFGKLTMPGLINAHTHSYMSLFRNCADDLSFSDWLFGRILQLEDKLGPKDIYYGALLACIEMIKTGTTCFLDMHPFKIETARAASHIGMRAVISRGLVDSDGMAGGLSRIAQAQEEMELFADDELITFMVAPHAVYTCSKEYLEEVNTFACRSGLPINIHLCETWDELNGIKEKYDCTPVEYLEQLGLLDHHTVAAHCVHLSANDIEILKKHGVFVATNPKSNLKLANGTAPVEKLISAGVKVCIGTDSAASNNVLNMFSEMNYAALLQKGITENPTAMSAQKTLECATVTAAEALNINSGQIAEGKCADLIMLDTDKVQFYPRSDMVSALVYSASGHEVQTVIINGEIVMLDGRLTTIDEQAVYKKCNEIYERINKD